MNSMIYLITNILSKVWGLKDLRCWWIQHELYFTIQHKFTTKCPSASLVILLMKPLPHNTTTLSQCHLLSGESQWDLRLSSLLIFAKWLGFTGDGQCFLSTICPIAPRDNVFYASTMNAIISPCTTSLLTPPQDTAAQPNSVASAKPTDNHQLRALWHHQTETADSLPG